MTYGLWEKILCEFKGEEVEKRGKEDVFTVLRGGGVKYRLGKKGWGFFFGGGYLYPLPGGGTRHPGFGVSKYICTSI